MVFLIGRVLHITGSKAVVIRPDGKEETPWGRSNSDSGTVWRR
jgi:hypothetical protein